MRKILLVSALALCAGACGNETEIAEVREEFGTVVVRLRAQNNTAAAGVVTFISQSGANRRTEVTNSSGLATFDSVAIGVWQAGWTENATYALVDATSSSTTSIAVTANRTTEANFTVRRIVTGPIDRERRR